MIKNKISIKKIKYRSAIILTAVFLLVIKFSGCEQEDMNFYIDCDYCLDFIPEYDTLWVKVTINEENPYVPLEFYIGDFENGQEDWIDTAYSETFWLVSEVEVNYSVKAKYQKNNDVIYAIDGDKIKVVSGEGECYPPCYYTKSGTLDVTLEE